MKSVLNCNCGPDPYYPNNLKPVSELAKDRLALKRTYRALFESADGRAVLADLERESGEGKDIFSPNANKTIHAVGKRSMVVYIKNMIKESD